MLAIAIDALYTTFRRRGTTRQLAGAIVLCVISALLLLPAIVWYNVRFAGGQTNINVVEVEVVLVYVALWGWVLPFGITVAYCLFTPPRTSTASTYLPRQKRTTKADPVVASFAPSRRQPGVPAPFVFNDDTPWGWLEHRNGRFQGQRLALKRTVVTIGRGEENDIWLDDDMASRTHVELAWDQGHVCVTDCDSLNGVQVNGRRIRGSVMIAHGELLEVGSHRFLLELAEPSASLASQDDPLMHHAPRSSVNLAVEETQSAVTPAPGEDRSKLALPLTPPLGAGNSSDFDGLIQQIASDASRTGAAMRQETAEVGQVAYPLPVAPAETYAFVICDGELSGKSFLLERPVLTIGRGVESDVVINDPSISRRHAQVVRQPNGVYVQDLASRNGSYVNGELLVAPWPLQPGDIVRLGNISLEYTSLQAARTVPLSMLSTPPLLRPTGGPMPLRLPSRPKEM
ncbi:MAG: FHA domain-containing protein [Ktedonobacteraceae bacterium]|nr:FHA domain-containing protein [Ktedonobacteraceae bacterium]